MDLSLFDYPLPPDRIAQEPAAERDGSRLLVLDRSTGARRHLAFREIGSVLRAPDLLVLNDTRVRPARLLGRRATGGRVEALLVRARPDGVHEALVRGAGRLRDGEELGFGDGSLRARVAGRDDGRVLLRFGPDLEAGLERFGRAPLPPYIRRAGTEDPAADRARYQTVYARSPGAVAAPTAGLHFTRALLDALASAGIASAPVTLHVGPGTFTPVQTERIEDHRMEAEEAWVPEETVAAVERARRGGGRVVAVGTTSLRALESAARGGALAPFRGLTDLFVHPGFAFRAVDALLTNFHLPRSTLLLLVAAFAGRERILDAYAEAVAMGYRFYSYGDAMLLV